MSKCFRLIDKTTSESVHPQEVDTEIRKFFGYEPNHNNWSWLYNWYNVIVYLIVHGSPLESEDLDKKITERCDPRHLFYMRQILTFLRERYTFETCPCPKRSR